MLELFENALLVACLNADAGVGHRHSHGLACPGDLRRSSAISVGFVLADGGDCDSSAIRRELDGVTEEVVHDLLELRLVRVQRGKVRPDFELQADGLLVGQRFDNGLHLAQSFGDGEGSLRINSTLPASTLARSRMSLMSWSRWRPLVRMLLLYLSWRSFRSPKVLSERISEKPMMALRGVRNSWLMLARNWLLARLADSAASFVCWRAASARRRCVTSRKIPSAHRVPSRRLSGQRAVMQPDPLAVFAADSGIPRRTFRRLEKSF